MSRIILLFVSLCTISLYCFSNSPVLKQDTLYYVEIEVKNKSSYPLVMAGVSKNLDFSTLSKESLDQFLNSFYMKTYFVPDLYKGYEEMIINCMGEDSGADYLDAHKNENLNMISQLLKNSITDKFLLNSGEEILISIVQISGSFWLVNKNFKGLLAYSDDVSINNIKEIQQVYIPFDIDYYRKLPKKMLKNALKDVF